MRIVPQKLPQSKGKKLLRPLKAFTWLSVLECATFELENARKFGSAERIAELEESVRIAQERLQRGEPFPVVPT